MLTKRGGVVLVVSISLQLISLTFYSINDFARFLLDTFGFDLSIFFPYIFKISTLAPYFFATGTLFLASLIASYLMFRGIIASNPIDVERSLSEERVFTGDFIIVTLRIKNKTVYRIHNLFVSDIIPDVFDLVLGENYFHLSILGNSEIVVSYILRCGARGDYYIGPTQVIIRDRFGLFMKEYLIDKKSHLLVYPPYEDVRRIEMLQRIYGGLLFGHYKVKEKGHGYDFWSLRKYVIGDPLKYVDWKATARKGELYVREYEAEKNVRLYIFIDASHSMGYGEKRRTKLDYAARAAVLLANIAARAQDLFGLVVYSNGIRDFVPASRGRKNIYLILESLAKMDPSGPSDLYATMREFIVRERHYTLAFIISDLEGDPGKIEDGIKVALAHKVKPIIIAPIGPLFEPQPTTEIGKAFREAIIAEYMRRRKRIKNALAKYRVRVYDVSPQELLVSILELFLRSKGRGVSLV